MRSAVQEPPRQARSEDSPPSACSIDDPKKYGPRPGFKRKRLLRFEKKQMVKELRAEIAADAPSFEDAIVQLDRALDAFGDRDESERLAAGWPKSPEGDWVPPGYARIEGWVPALGPRRRGGPRFPVTLVPLVPFAKGRERQAEPSTTTRS